MTWVCYSVHALVDNDIIMTWVCYSVHALVDNDVLVYNNDMGVL